jgi:hypothetical protein
MYSADHVLSSDISQVTCHLLHTSDDPIRDSVAVLLRSAYTVQCNATEKIQTDNRQLTQPKFLPVDPDMTNAL